MYFSANPNGEAETIKVYLKPKPKLKKLIFEVDFSKLAIKGRQSMGNIMTRHQVHRIVLKEAGVSTLGGLKLWFDEVVYRLSTDERGKYLGEFKGDDKILVVDKAGNYHMTNFDLSNHYPDDILLIEKFKPGKVFSAVFYDADQEYYYLRRLEFEETIKEQSLVGENPESKLVLLTAEKWPQIKIVFGGKHADRDDEVINVEEFITVKSVKARGKRLTNYEVQKIIEVEPLQKEEPEDETPQAHDSENGDNDDSPIKPIEPESRGEQMSLGFD
jgi:topoisomerase-4 subunit A